MVKEEMTNLSTFQTSEDVLRSFVSLSFLVMKDNPAQTDINRRGFYASSRSCTAFRQGVINKTARRLLHFYLCFLKTGSHYAALTVLELTASASKCWD